MIIITRFSIFAITLIAAVSLSFGTVMAQPQVDQIISNAIAKRISDKQSCTSFTNMAVKKEMKYDSDFNPKEITTLRMKVYHVDTLESAEVLFMDKDGEKVEPRKVREKIEDLNKKWREEQEDEDKGSRDNFVDPLTEEGRGDYTYKLLDTRDSTFATITGAVTATDSSGQQVTIDESIDRLLTYYVVEATSTVEDQKHIATTYWIDSESFGVLHQVFKPAKLPRFVHRLDFQLDFQIMTMGGKELYLPSRFELKGKAGFLFFKGHFGVIETYSNYDCDPEMTSTPSKQRYYYKGDEKQES